MMKRRTFLSTATGLTAYGFSYPLLWTGPRPGLTEATGAGLTPSLFLRRLARAQELMNAHSIDLLIATPGSSFAYFVNANPGRSERLIALLVPREGEARIVCPAFEEGRIRLRSVITTIDVWQEEEDPFHVVEAAAKGFHCDRGRIGIEPTTNFVDFLRIQQALSNAKVVSGEPIFEELRSVKSEEEIKAIRSAVDITLASIRATHEIMKEGATELEVSRALSGEMRSRGAGGGGLVQFGPSSALPHGGPTGGKLTRGSVVLIDAGCGVDGYTSDITRTIFWGGEPSAKYREVFNVVFEAQRAAASTARSGVPCEDVDRAARTVIEKRGFGKFFTHRTGHGIGLDGHEHPYLVKGNTNPLEEGNVVTIEPGIYIGGEFGVRIEDDFLITRTGAEQLSSPVKEI